MNTVNKYGMEWAGPRRKASWKRRLGCWLWSLIWMVLVSLALWGLFSLATGRVTAGDVMPVSGLKPELRTAGFGVPEWVAYGITGTVVMGILARLGWGAMQEAVQTPEMGEPPEHDPMEVGGNAIPPSDKVQTFEAQGKVWTRHVPGDPMPCSALALVTTLLEDGEIGGTGIRASKYDWGVRNDGEQIIGWRLAEVSQSPSLRVSESSTKEGAKA